ncbi:MAG: LacI family DNA-binding transcriptional regulator, partial [Candidatus Limivicinus sp.]
MVTLKQIAEYCGVSLSTASKALNGAPDISERTVLQVREAAESLGYMPNAAARALKTHRSYVFGILFAAAVEQGLTHEFFARILNSFKNQAGGLGYDIFFLGDHIGERQISYAEHARYRNCDGVLAVVGSQRDEVTVRELAEAGLPLVCVDAAFDGLTCVLSDNEQGMAALTDYVIAQGHRRIALIHGEDSYVTRQ